MPIALDRSELAEVSLRSDRDKPEAERPVFLFHYLTRREVRQINAWRKDADGVETVDGVEAIVDKIIRLGLSDWRNIRGRDGEPVPFSLDAVDDVLTFNEKMELAVFYPQLVDAAETAKKKASASASTTPTAESAAGAPAESASTPPPSTLP